MNKICINFTKILLKLSLDFQISERVDNFDEIYVGVKNNFLKFWYIYTIYKNISWE